jgi:lysophospholipase
MNITGFDARSYIDRHRDNATALPNIGIAASGGGYRAMLNAGGALAAFDSRTPNSTNTGQLGGLLQSATYLAGLSGGGWLVGSLMANNFTSVQDLMNAQPDQSGGLWQLSQSILEGPQTSRIQTLSTIQYYNELLSSVRSKEDAGFNFNTSLTDYWGRALSFQLINAPKGGPSYTWSSIADDVEFAAGRTPLPILIADERAPGELLISLNTTVFEFNPWEMGSFDPTLYGFAPLRYLGSNFTEGELPESQRCISGFDNAGFIMGTSSSLFNQIILNLDGVADVPQVLSNILQSLLQLIGRENNDIADYTPNPFLHFNNQSNPSAQTERLTLVDGGEDLQNIPLHPLIQPFRHVDVVFAMDSSADTIAPHALNWPNGTSLGATYARSLNESMQNGTAFPAVPDTNTFVNLGLNTRPSFFGCDPGNLTGPAPLIVYIPNFPYTYNSNVSTFQMSYNNTERNAIIQNGYNVATMGNGTRDAQWPTCVGCAVLSRSWDRTGTRVPDVCRQCFDRYCWDGTVNTTTPAPYFPQSVLTQVSVKAGAGHFAPSFIALILAAGVSILFVL